MNPHTTIIGKSAESEKLSRSVKEAGKGNPQIVFVSGAAGIGKSTLIRNIEYPTGYRVFETNVPEEESPSYSIIANFIRQTDITGKLQKQNSKALAAYLGYFLPEIHLKNAPRANFDILVSVFRAMIENLTKTDPIVWIIEDLQWADLASLEILANLFITGTPLSFALIATYRNEQISRDHSIRRIRTKLRRNRGFSEVELQAFTENEVSEFIETRFSKIPSPGLVKTLYYLSGGLPLLMNEILDTLQKRKLLHTENNELKLEEIDYLPIPENIRDLVTLQMVELTTEARDLAEIAASYGTEFSFGFLEKFTPAIHAIKALKEIAVSELASGNLDLLASTYRELAACYGLKGSWNSYQESQLKAIVLYGKSGNYADTALEQMDLAEFLFKNLKLKNALRIIDKALQNAENAERQDIYTRCLALKGYLLAISGNSDEGFELANNAVHMGLQQNNTLATAEAYRRLAGALEYASSFQESLKAYDVAFHFCNTHQLDFQETQCLSCMSWVLLRTGDWRKCFEVCRTVLEHPGSINVSKCTANGILSLMRAYRGEIKTARKNLNDTFRLAPEIMVKNTLENLKNGKDVTLETGINKLAEFPE